MLNEVTNQIYKLIEGKESVKFGLPRNKYTRYLLDPESSPPSNIKTNQYYVNWGFPTPLEGIPYNQYDPMRLIKINFTVYLLIPITGISSKIEESTLHELIKKYNADIMDIRECLTFGENYGNVTEQMISVTSLEEVTASVENDVLFLEIPFSSQQYIFTGIENSWLPSQIPNLYAWYKSDAANFTYDGSNLISQWSDLSGNGKHAVQTIAGRKPTFVASGGIKNKAYMSTTYSAGAGKGLLAGTTGDWNFLHNGSEFTVVAVAQTSGTNWNWLLGTQTSGITNVGFSISSTESSGKRFSVSIGNGTIDVATIGPYGNSIDSTKPFKVIARFSNETFPKDALFVKVNDKTYSTPLIASPLNSSFGVLGIGAGGTGLYSADSRFYELMVFNRKLTDNEIRQVEAYLNKVYGI